MKMLHWSQITILEQSAFYTLLQILKYVLFFSYIFFPDSIL